MYRYEKVRMGREGLARPDVPTGSPIFGSVPQPVERLKVRLDGSGDPHLECGGRRDWIDVESRTQGQLGFRYKFAHFNPNLSRIDLEYQLRRPPWPAEHIEHWVWTASKLRIFVRSIVPVR